MSTCLIWNELNLLVRWIGQCKYTHMLAYLPIPIVGLYRKMKNHDITNNVRKIWSTKRTTSLWETLFTLVHTKHCYVSFTRISTPTQIFISKGIINTSLHTNHNLETKQRNSEAHCHIYQHRCIRHLQYIVAYFFEPDLQSLHCLNKNPLELHFTKQCSLKCSHITDTSRKEFHVSVWLSRASRTVKVRPHFLLDTAVTSRYCDVGGVGVQ